jgi:hypothetical protein
MSYESVDIKVVDTTPSASPLAGVTVKIMSQDGRLVFGQPVTDANGIVALLMPTGIFQLRFFKFGVTFSAQLIEVLPAPQVNTFKVKGETYVYPQSTDTRICIAAGIFRTPTGGIARGIDMHFIAKWSPILLDNSAIMPERVTQRSNNNGYAEVPLIRFGQYNVTIEGMEDYQRVISVPDAPAVNISNLLFPRVTVITFEEPGPYTVQQGETLYLTPHVFSSDLNELTNLFSDVLWSTTESSLLALDTSVSGKIGVRGSLAGTYQLFADRRDKTIIQIPNTPIQGVPVTITVTP